MPKKISTLIADDHGLFRSGLKQALGCEMELDVVGEASTGREVLSLMPQLQPRLLLIDIVMPELNGIETIRQLAADYPGTCVLVISTYTAGRYVGEALEAGASGYVAKGASMSELNEAIRTVLNGDTWLSPSVAGAVVHRYVRSGSGNGNGNGNGEKDGDGRHRHDAATSTLSPREREVLQMLAEGYAGKQIAAALNLSVKTVDTHRAVVMRKLKLQNLAHLTKYAIREGITTLDY
jgi:DNA-binding NarL/FixJ family response regulator